MKKNSNKQDKSIKEENEEITRKDALIKVGKYAAVTAAAMLIVLSPKQSQAQSSVPTPGWGS
jgi:hypothetical protein